MKIIPEQNKRGLELDFSNLRVLCVHSLSIFFSLSDVFGEETWL